MNFLPFYYGILIIYGIAFYFIEYPFVSIFLIFAVIPLIDESISSDFQNPVKGVDKETEGRFAYKLPLYAAIIADWLFMFRVITYLTYSQVAIINQIGLLFLAGNLALLNINIGHELLHKDDKLQKFIGTYTLLKNLNIHYSQEHVFGHHRYVATPLDPVSAPKGTSLINHVLPAFKNSYVQACSFEKHKPLLEQKMFRYTTQYVLMILFMTYLFGIKGGFYFFVQALLSIFAIIGADYTEHYGLRRKELSPGTYEQFQAKHSWNSSNTILNYVLFKVQRHSDHHMHPFKEYQNLIIEKDYPILPCSFLLALVLAAFPSQWFSIMDDLIDNKKGLEEARQKVKKFLYKFALGTGTVAMISMII